MAHGFTCSRDLETLAESGIRRAVEPIVALLDDTGYRLFMRAAEALGDLRYDRTIDPVTAVFGTHGHLVGKKIGEALAEPEGARVVEPLIDAGKGEDYHVFVTIAEAPGKSGDGRPIMALLEELEEDNLDTSAKIAKIARVPREYGGPRAVEHLERVEKEISELRRQIDARTRRA